MNIRVLLPADAASYQRLRLRALRECPSAFGSTYEREAAFTDAFVAERLQPTEGRFTLGAFEALGELVGIVTFVREGGAKTSHKGNVYGMYVAPERQGMGIGKSLLLELVRSARGLAGLEQLHLAVVSGNDAARRLYESAGFRVYGTEPNALQHDGTSYDEHLMVLQWAQLRGG
ncbi:GNAT family N-acetyltransferase [Paenibacillus sp. TRM 82003]|nr:GNAT family N-acetyltransferase [Paenibacillus sp. TRM 82003]